MRRGTATRGGSRALGAECLDSRLRRRQKGWGVQVNAVEAGSGALVGETNARAVPRVHQGRFAVVVDGGVLRDEVALEPPRVGLSVPPMIWATRYTRSSDALPLVLPSVEYDAAEHIRDDDEHLGLARR